MRALYVGRFQPMHLGHLRVIQHILDEAEDRLRYWRDVGSRALMSVLKLSDGGLGQVLEEAVEEAEKSKLVREALGDHIFEKFIENKKIEWDMYCTHVSRYELEKYLPIL